MSTQDAQDDPIHVELRYIRRDLDDIKGKLDDNYVTKDEFSPVKNLVYGMVALILTAVVGALIALVVS